MVTEIPEYTAPAVDLDDAETSEADLPYSAFLSPPSEHQIAEQRRRANKAPEWRDQQAAIRAKPGNADSTPAPRKPPATVNSAPKERTNTPRASGG